MRRLESRIWSAFFFVGAWGLLSMGFMAATAAGNPVVYAWFGSGGDPLPFPDAEAVEGFLREADVVSLQRAPVGTTAPSKVLLRRDGVSMNACFRHVKVFQRQARLQSGALRYDFRDDAIFEVAAYQLGKLLGLNNIPPTVVREVQGKIGTLQAWVEGTIMEKDRIEQHIQPPDRWRWTMELQRMLVFDNLIFNEDRNVGNVLIDSDWKIWMIDHTRAFTVHAQLPSAKLVKACELGLWERLQGLEEAAVQSSLEEYLTAAQIRSLMKRRDLLLQHVRKLVDERGGGRVFYTLGEETSGSVVQ